MAIEIFGFIFKPEISIGDIAAIVALISSALIFWFGYRRNRKSEQIRIARELMDRIDMKKQKLDIYIKANPPAIIEEGDGSFKEAETSYYVAKEFHKHILEVISEMEYFIYLVDKHELEDRKVLKYYKPKVRDAIDDSYSIIAETRSRIQKYPYLLDELERDLDNLYDSRYIESGKKEEIVEKKYMILKVIFYPFFRVITIFTWRKKDKPKRPGKRPI